MGTVTGGAGRTGARESRGPVPVRSARADQANESVKERWIAGVAYWPRMNTSSVSSAVLLDYEQVRYRDFAPARPTEKRIIVHMLFSF